MGPRVRALLRKYIHREVSGGVVVGVDLHLVESRFCEADSFCSIEGYRFWLGGVVRVGVDFCSVFSFPSQVWWI